MPLPGMTVAGALRRSGPGKYSLDHVLGTRLPRWVILPGVAFAAAGVALGVLTSPEVPAAQEQDSDGALQVEGGEPTAEQDQGTDMAAAI